MVEMQKTPLSPLDEKRPEEEEETKVGEGETKVGEGEGKPQLMQETTLNIDMVIENPEAAEEELKEGEGAINPLAVAMEIDETEVTEQDVTTQM